MEESSRETSSSAPAAEDSRGRSKVARDLIAGVLVGTLVLGAVYYLYLGKEEASSERTSQPASTAEAPPSQPLGSEQRVPDRTAAQEAVPAAPPPTPSGSSEAQAPPSAASEPRPPVEGSAQAQNPPNANETATRPEPTAPDPMRDQSVSLPAPEVAFVQGTRVNIRSDPNARAQIVGHASKGEQLTVIRRAGRWVQVDTGRGQGWVSASLLGPRSP